MFNISKKQIFDLEEFNRLIEYAESNTTILNMRVEQDPHFGKYYSLSDVSYLWAGPKNIILTTKKEKKACSYWFTLDGSEADMTVGGLAYAQLKKAVAKEPYEVIPDFSNNEYIKAAIGFDPTTGKFANQTAGLLYYNPKFNHKETKAWAYDINSAYLSRMMQQIPRTDYIKDFDREVGEKEVGFLFDKELTLVNHGYADIIFDLVETPEGLKKFAKRWYDRKKNKADKYHTQAKTIINAAIGCLQYHNPFLRSYIVNSCNYFIKSLMNDKTTITCNTDCIVSAVPLDLKVGTELGEWSLDTGNITINNYNYIADWKTSLRGVLKNELIYKFENRRISKL